MAALEIERREPPPGETLRRAVDDFATAATPEGGDERQRYVLGRILVAIIAQAARAHEAGVARKADIDTALRYGANYPKGPFEWAEQIGDARCRRLLEALNETADDNRFADRGHSAIPSA